MSKTGNVEGVTRKKDAARARPPHGLSHANVLLVQASGTCGISSRCCSKASPEKVSRTLPAEMRAFLCGAHKGQQSEAHLHSSEATSQQPARSPRPSPDDKHGRPGRAHGSEPQETTEGGWQKSAPRGGSRSPSCFGPQGDDRHDTGQCCSGAVPGTAPAASRHGAVASGPGSHGHPGCDSYCPFFWSAWPPLGSSGAKFQSTGLRSWWVFLWVQ